MATGKERLAQGVPLRYGSDACPELQVCDRPYVPAAVYAGKVNVLARDALGGANAFADSDPSGDAAAASGQPPVAALSVATS